MKRNKLTVAGLLLVVIAALGTGCSANQEQIDSARANVATATATLDAATAAVDTIDLSIDAESRKLLEESISVEVMAKVQDTIAELTERKAQAVEYAAHAKTVLENADAALASMQPGDPGAGITAAGTVITTSAPAAGPYAPQAALLGTVLTTIGGIITTFWQRKKRIRAEDTSANLVGSISLAAASNGDPGIVNFNDPKTVNLLNMLQDPDTQDLIDAVGDVKKTTKALLNGTATN